MTTVEIDDDIYSVLEARAEEKGFDETREYIEHLLDQVVEKIQKEKQKEGKEYTEEEEEKVKDRLRGLGYLD